MISHKETYAESRSHRVCIAFIQRFSGGWPSACEFFRLVEPVENRPERIIRLCESPGEAVRCELAACVSCLGTGMKKHHRKGGNL